MGRTVHYCNRGSEHYQATVAASRRPESVHTTMGETLPRASTLLDRGSSRLLHVHVRDPFPNSVQLWRWRRIHECRVPAYSEWSTYAGYVCRRRTREQGCNQTSQNEWRLSAFPRTLVSWREQTCVAQLVSFDVVLISEQNNRSLSTRTRTATMTGAS